MLSVLNVRCINKGGSGRWKIQFKMIFREITVIEKSAMQDRREEINKMF